MSLSASPAEPSAIRFNRWLTLIAITYGVFVLYGSLVPLEMRPLEWAEAWRRFSQIPYLSLGTGRRADWVANILLYIPLAFLWCACAHSRKRWGTAGFVLIFCVAFAVFIEFFQLWFPPRTVSQNDLLAESLGSLIGVTIWLIAGQRLIGLARTIFQGGRAGLDAAFIAYTGLYVAYSLFPFDFLVSGQELSAKLASRAIAPGITPSCGGLLRCGVNLTIETLSFVPFGLFMTYLLKRPGTPPPKLMTALLLGGLVGGAIEGMQIFIASGISQGISIGARALGMMLRVAIGRAWSVTWLTAWLPLARAALFAGVLGYGLLLAAIAWRGGWQADGALLRLGALNWLPFYYHYYTTEQNSAAKPSPQRRHVCTGRDSGLAMAIRRNARPPDRPAGRYPGVLARRCPGRADGSEPAAEAIGTCRTDQYIDRCGGRLAQLSPDGLVRRVPAERRDTGPNAPSMPLCSLSGRLSFRPL